jgi:hypothetical protein
MHTKLTQVFASLRWKSDTPNTWKPQVVVFAARIFQLCLLSYSLQKQYVFLRVCDDLPDAPLDVCKAITDCTFFHAGMEMCIQSTFANEITSVSLYYQKYARNKALVDQMDDTQISYLAYLSDIQENRWMFPMRVLSTSSNRDAHKLDRVVLFATIKKLGEGIDLNTLDTVCLASPISARRRRTQVPTENFVCRSERTPTSPSPTTATSSTRC